MGTNAIFLTGVTGALGKEIVKTALTTGDEKLFLLIRRKNRSTHWDRARKILESCGLESYLGTRVHVMEGDITLPSLGLSTADIEILRREVTVFHHIAALTALNASEEECTAVNLRGTEETLALAVDLWRTGRLERFFYFSTAYVAGSLQTYCAREDELPEHPAHANYYESSKYEAERRVRAAMRNGFPATIFRPSIVVGDSRTGEVSEFNVIYPFMKLFAHGILTQLPTRPENTFNIVPIDFVVQAALCIARQKESIGKTFHLVAPQPPSIGMLLQLKEEEYPDMPPVEMIPPEDFRKEGLDPMQQTVHEMLSPYLGYLNGHLTFDTKNTEKALEGAGIASPKTDYGFLKTICQYAFDAGYLIRQ